MEALDSLMFMNYPIIPINTTLQQFHWNSEVSPRIWACVSRFNIHTVLSTLPPPPHTHTTCSIHIPSLPSHRTHTFSFCHPLPHTLTSHTSSQDDSEGYPQLDIDDVLKIAEDQREDSLRVSACHIAKCFSGHLCCLVVIIRAGSLCYTGQLE